MGDEDVSEGGGGRKVRGTLLISVEKREPQFKAGKGKQQIWREVVRVARLVLRLTGGVRMGRQGWTPPMTRFHKEQGIIARGRKGAGGGRVARRLGKAA